MSASVYFTALDGIRYRELDCVWQAGKFVPANPGTAGATVRIFRLETGPRRLYRFAAVEARGVEEGELAQQLTTSEFLPTVQPGPAGHVDPR